MMTSIRIALANLPFPPSPDESVRLAIDAICNASRERADLICFPECYVPGYRCLGRHIPVTDAAFLERAWAAIAATAAESNVAVVLGTERIIDGAPRISALVIDRDGTMMGFQDKVQLDPSEDSTYAPGADRHLFHTGPLTFGIAICHEGFRYPETVRWAAVRGAQIVFHPHVSEVVGRPPGGRWPYSVFCCVGAR
jgi:predicted amidohydrolase